jgi:hypothetical protein
VLAFQVSNFTWSLWDSVQQASIRKRKQWVWGPLRDVLQPTSGVSRLHKNILSSVQKGLPARGSTVRTPFTGIWHRLRQVESLLHNKPTWVLNFYRLDGILSQNCISLAPISISYRCKNKSYMKMLHGCYVVWHFTKKYLKVLHILLRFITISGSYKSGAIVSHPLCYEVAWPPSDITFIPNFVKIGQLVQKLKEQMHTQQTYKLTSLPYRKKSRLTISRPRRLWRWRHNYLGLIVESQRETLPKFKYFPHLLQQICNKTE